MTDSTAYPPEWLDAAGSHPLDPILGTDLDPFRPDAQQRADVAELALAYTRREHGFGDDYLHWAAARYADKAWPQAFLALLDLLESTAIAAQGERLTTGRLASGLASARTDALLERGAS